MTLGVACFALQVISECNDALSLFFFFFQVQGSFMCECNTKKYK